MKSIAINCDLGEGFGNEIELMPHITACNIACGGHAGDAATVRHCVQLAKCNKVQIGAHPSFVDREQFGRAYLDITPVQLLPQLVAQVKLVQQACAQYHVPMQHVKAHGALYNLAASDDRYGQVLLDLIKSLGGGVLLYVPAGSRLQALAKSQGIGVVREAFADRNYQENLQLVSRNEPNALLKTAHDMAVHIARMVTKQQVLTVSGVEVPLQADSFCIHGDQVGAGDRLQDLIPLLLKHQIKISQNE